MTGEGCGVVDGWCGIGLGAGLGEIPAAGRGYDGSFCVGLTEWGRGRGGGGAGVAGEASVRGGWMGGVELAWVLGSARYPRRGAGMTDLFAWVWQER